MSRRFVGHGGCRHRRGVTVDDFDVLVWGELAFGRKGVVVADEEFANVVFYC